MIFICILVEKSTKKVKTFDFFNMCYFIFEIEIINIAFAKKIIIVF